jgi:hypothetical protein
MTSAPRLRPAAALLAGVVGFAWFWLRFGWGALDVTRVDWLMAGDWGQNEIGWQLFRHAPWGFPLGAIPSLLYPVGSSVALTDATPLVSLLLKPFSAHLPPVFQFIGPWLALCFVLQGIAGALLTSAFTRDLRQQALGGCLFALAPVLDLRVGHASLCAQWLLLWALWLALRPAPDEVRVGRWVGLAVGGVALSALVHPYLWAMVTVLAFALLFRLHLEGRATGARLWVAAAGMLGVSLLLFWSLGLLGGSVGASGMGFGAYNSDLLTLVNPLELSRLLPGLPQKADQWEGAGYLGLGGLLLVGSAAIWAWPRRRALPLAERWRWRPVAIAAGLMALFAVASVVSVAGHVLVSARTLLRPLEPLTGVFRASGRFIWPLHYALLTAAIAVTVRRWPRAWVASGVLLLAVAVQALDARRGPIDTRAPQAWNRLRSPRWEALAKGRAHLVLYPTQLHVGGGEGCPYEEALPPGLYVSAGWFAALHGMTVNSGYVSRVDSKGMQAACAALIRRVRGGEVDPDTLYVVADAWSAEFRRPGVHCERVEGLLGCIAGEVSLLRPSASSGGSGETPQVKAPE